MRQGQQNNNNKRMRGRNHRKGPNPLTRSFESNGGDVKIRGTAIHVAEKYVQLARDAQSSGDRVAAENYLQHAEHYYRIVAAAQAQLPPQQQVFRNDEEGGDDDDGQDNRANGYNDQQPPQSGQPQAFGLADPQPYVNGVGQGQAEPEDDGGPADGGDSRFEPRDMGQLGQARDMNQGRDMRPPRDNNNYGGGGGGGGYNNNRPNEHGGNYRGGRRRRPFRERFNEPRDQQREGGGDNNPPAPPVVADTPRSEE